MVREGNMERGYKNVNEEEEKKEGGKNIGRKGQQQEGEAQDS